MPTQVPDSWVERLNGAPLSPWFEQHVADRGVAMHGFLTNRIHLGHLNVMDRDLVMADWISLLGNQDGFRSQVDDALRIWISTNWGRFDLLRPAALAEVWVCVSNIVAFASPELPASAAELLAHFGDRENFLGALSDGPSRDPLGRYLCAIARNQTNAKLAPFWNWLCDLPEAVPFYHSLYALEGVAGLPTPQTSDAAAQFDMIASALLRLAKGFHRHVLAEVTSEDIAKREWVNLAHWCQTKFPFAGRWEEFTRSLLPTVEQLPPRILGWFCYAFPTVKRDVEEKQAEIKQKHLAAHRFAPFQDWTRRSRELRRALQDDFQTALPKAKRLLDEQRRFADESNDPYNVVRSLCNFADVILRNDKDLALTWAEEARNRDPQNPFTWTTVAKILKGRGQIVEAEAVAQEAYGKFQGDVACHTFFAEILRGRHKLDDAEKVYRLAFERFPDDAIVRSGMAEVIRSFPDRLAEAEAIYRECVELFPQDARSRNGLAEVLKEMGRLSEAEFAYQETMDLFPQNEVVKNGLADLCVDLGKFDQAEELYSEVLESSVTSKQNAIIARTGLAGVLRRLNRFDEARAQIEIVLHRLDANNLYAKAELEHIIAAEKGEPVPERPKPAATESLDWISGSITPTQRRILLARISWLRRQVKTSTSADQQSATMLRAQALKLADALLERFPDDERALAQKCLLNLDAGDLDATAANLKAALSLRPNAQFLLTLRARVDRILAKKNSVRLVPDKEPEVFAAPHRLRQLRPELRPLVLLQQGLGYLALTDGELRKDRAAQEFGKLHRWVQHRLDPQTNPAARIDDEDEDAGPKRRPELESGTDADFHKWWAGQIHRNVFVPVLDQKEPKPADIPKLGEQVEAKSALVEQMEECFVSRLSARNDWDPTLANTA